MDKIEKLLKIPQYEQRSPEWFKQRENKLTSSDAATALGINPYQKSHEVLFKKCGHDLNPFIGNVATLHGQKYEDEAIQKYCKITGRVNYNYGLISHEDVYNNKAYYWLAGSPDGIAISKTELNDKPVLLEVKCPYRRVIKHGQIPDYYLPQVQLNMFICDLEIADFIEYRPPNEINIVRVNRDEAWLKENLEKLEKFWKEIEFYRENDIKKHPKFPKPKKIIDLIDKLSIDSSDESETFILSDYSIKEPCENSKAKCKCKCKSVSKCKCKCKSVSKCNSEYIILNDYSIKDI
jgi:putative phage-type endonuclease